MANEKGSMATSVIGVAFMFSLFDSTCISTIPRGVSMIILKMICPNAMNEYDPIPVSWPLDLPTFIIVLVVILISC